MNINPHLTKEQQEALQGIVKSPEFDLSNQEFSYEQLPLKKRLFYATMVKTFGNVGQACEISGIKRGTYNYWMKHDSDFYNLIEKGDFENRLLDFAESALVKKVGQGDIIAILFLLKTKGKKRGYIESGHVEPERNKDRKPAWFDTAEDIDHEVVEPKHLPNVPSADLDEETA